MKSIDQQNIAMLERIMNTPSSKQLQLEEHIKFFKLHKRLKKSLSRSDRHDVFKTYIDKKMQKGIVTLDRFKEPSDQGES